LMNLLINSHSSGGTPSVYRMFFYIRFEKDPLYGHLKKQNVIINVYGHQRGSKLIWNNTFDWIG
jgi:hypothetical protein